jgi:hypothetical protein
VQAIFYDIYDLLFGIIPYLVKGHFFAACKGQIDPSSPYYPTITGLNMTTNPGAFYYQPLDVSKKEIRLCRVQNLNTSNYSSFDINLKLEHYSRLNVTSIHSTGYIALSYTWGPKKPAYPVLINGRMFEVRENLYRFLQVVSAQEDHDSWFWVDQLAINQNDISERTEQVGQMSDIYHHAKKVFVWLGPSVDDSDLAMSLLEKWISDSSALTAPFELFDFSDRFWRESEPREWDALYKFFSRRYWSRLWIVSKALLIEYQETSWRLRSCHHCKVHCTNSACRFKRSCSRRLLHWFVVQNDSPLRSMDGSHLKISSYLHRRDAVSCQDQESRRREN